MRSLVNTCRKFTAESDDGRKLNIGQRFAKLSARVECPVF